MFSVRIGIDKSGATIHFQLTGYFEGIIQMKVVHIACLRSRKKTVNSEYLTLIEFTNS